MSELNSSLVGFYQTNGFLFTPGLPTYTQLVGWDANKILSESVVQLQRKDEDRWDLNIRPGETHMFENNPFRFDNQRQHHKTHFELQSSHPNTIV